MSKCKLNLSKYNISPGRRKELEGFCQQYYLKKDELKEIYALSSISPDSSVKSGVPGKPTENKAMRANQLKRDIEIIDKAFDLACGCDVGIIEPLKRNIILEIGYESLGNVPCGVNKFSEYRRKFYIFLDKEKKS